ncbi:hypothetical protein [Bacteroides acidifaciens]|nr:hypothetical protein [Bacteroides acidifaciens]
MDLTCRMSPEERLEMKRKRIAFIQETTKEAVSKIGAASFL